MADEKIKRNSAASGRGSSRKGPERRRSKCMSALRWILRILIILVVIVGIAMIALYVRTRPLYADAQKQVYTILSQMNDGTFKRESNTLVYDGDDKLLSKIGYENYKYETIDKVSNYVQMGYIDVEDKKFLTHHGVDYPRTIKAALLYLKGKIGKDKGITQGGSTITQQVVKNNLLSQEQTLERKFLEILLARQIEKEYSKSQIMEYYVNSCYYGNGCYGIEGAAEYYFGVSANDLDLAQAAMLVGTSNSPNVYNPAADYELSLKKKSMVLGQMLKEGDITKEQYDSADAEKPKIVKKTDKSDPDNYMVSFAIHDAAIKLMEYQGFEFKYKFGSESEYKKYKAAYKKAYNAADSKIRSGGYEIHTAFDQKIQKKLQNSIDDTLSGEKEEQDNGQYSLQSAGVVVDNKSGCIVAAVGGRGASGSYNRAFQAVRQPGSTIKPLLDYGPGIDKGVITPGTVMVDKPVTIEGYSPKNFNGSYMGQVTVRQALARSLNTIALQIYDETGSEAALSYLQKLKFSTLTYGDAYNSAIALGGFTNGVTVEDMARGYAAIENDGDMRDTTCIRSIKTETGEKIYTRGEEKTQIFSKDTAFMLRDMMEGVFKESYGTAHSAFDSGQVYAGKTGTTDNNKDAWFAGFSAYYTAVTWVGCDTPQQVKGLTGGGYPLSIWSSFMDKMHKDKDKEEFDIPSSIMLQNSSGRQKNVSYTNNVYDSRPSGWDYVSQSLTETLADNEAKREEKRNYDDAAKAVDDFEDFQISSAADAMALDEKYNYVTALVDQVGDSDKHGALQERAEYKYSLLSGDVRDKWEDEIAAAKQQAQDDENISNAKKADNSAYAALAQIKKIRIGIVQSYIDYFNDVKIYTDSVDEMADYAEKALEACADYDEYAKLGKKLSSAEEKARSQKTVEDLKKEQEEARRESEEARKAQEEARHKEDDARNSASSSHSDDDE